MSEGVENIQEPKTCEACANRRESGSVRPRPFCDRSRGRPLIQSNPDMWQTCGKFRPKGRTLQDFVVEGRGEFSPDN